MINMCVRSNTEDFIKKAKEVHGERFDYSEVDYVTCAKPVIITCNEHGDFKQKPSEHLRSVGCSKCSKVSKITKEEFLSLSKGLHGDIYDYSKIDFNGVNVKIEIICHKHGSFLQIPKSHIKGYSCRLLR